MAATPYNPNDPVLLRAQQGPTGLAQAAPPPNELAAVAPPPPLVGPPKPPAGGVPPPPPPPPPPPAPAGGPMDPNAAMNQLQVAAQQRFGRQLTQAELTALYAQPGVNYSGSGPVSPEQLAAAQGVVGRYSGNLQDPWGALVGGPAAAAPAAPAAPAGPASNLQPGPVDPGTGTNATVQALLQQLLTTGQSSATNPTYESLTAGNPAYAAQRQAFDRQNAAATTHQRIAGAERNAARGTLGAGGFDAEQSAVDRGSADRSTQFEAQLMTGELNAQRERVSQALSLAASSGNAALARQLQERLSLIDADLRQQALKSQTELGRGQLGLGQGQLNLGLLNALLGNQQANNALGFNYANLGQQGNNALMQYILEATR